MTLLKLYTAAKVMDSSPNLPMVLRADVDIAFSVDLFIQEITVFNGHGKHHFADIA